MFLAIREFCWKGVFHSVKRSNFSWWNDSRRSNVLLRCYFNSLRIHSFIISQSMAFNYLSTGVLLVKNSSRTLDLCSGLWLVIESHNGIDLHMEDMYVLSQTWLTRMLIQQIILNGIQSLWKRIDKLKRLLIEKMGYLTMCNVWLLVRSESWSIRRQKGSYSFGESRYSLSSSCMRPARCDRALHLFIKYELF